jgi:sugar transferase EpsL
MPSRHRVYRDQVKPLVDRYVAAVALIVGAPLLLVVALAVWWSLSRPVLFRQARLGRHGRPFRLAKFRTMRENERNLGDDDARLTSVGRFLRRFSLDELPQLWNVLQGDMSLVGPRPLLPEYRQIYTPEQARRHEVLPGVTGWSQVNGRNGLDWQERLRLDVWYVDHMSLGLDLKILALTCLKAFTGQEICPATYLPGSEHLFDKDVDHETRRAA